MHYLFLLKLMGLCYSLQERLLTEWESDKVKLLFGDMRTLEVPEKVDILVSELLGSFGDNELSPECLDGAMRFLKRESFVAPLSTAMTNIAQRTGYQYRLRTQPFWHRSHRQSCSLNLAPTKTTRDRRRRML